MKKLLIILALAFLMCAVTNCFAEPPNPAFDATCECVENRGYRNMTDLAGKRMKAGWTTNESFGGSWNFIYSGGDSIVIDGKQVSILMQHPGVLIAGDIGGTGFASSAWTYAINLGLGTIVASQVNAYGHPTIQDTGVKVRALSFKCKFNIHKASPP